MTRGARRSEGPRVVAVSLPPESERIVVVAGWSRALPRDECERVERLVHPHDRARSALGQVLARRLVGEAVRRPWTAVRLDRDANGRPCAEGIDVNVAHAGRWVVAAAHARRVGVDVESVQAVGMVPRAAFLSAAELVELGRLLPESARGAVAAGLWCLKEAEGKAAGDGLAGLVARAFRPAAAMPPAASIVRDRVHSVVRGPGDGYMTAVSWDGESGPVRLRRLRLAEVAAATGLPYASTREGTA